MEILDSWIDLVWLFYRRLEVLDCFETEVYLVKKSFFISNKNDLFQST